MTIRLPIEIVVYSIASAGVSFFLRVYAPVIIRIVLCLVDLIEIRRHEIQGLIPRKKGPRESELSSVLYIETNSKCRVNIPTCNSAVLRYDNAWPVTVHPLLGLLSRTTIPSYVIMKMI